jgi:hypothetical protein
MPTIFEKISGLVQTCVESVRPKDKDAMCSVDPRLMLLFCFGMVGFADIKNDDLQFRTTALLLCNIIVRLTFPSQYCPATASKSGVIAHPLTARCIAFVAEVRTFVRLNSLAPHTYTLAQFSMYEVWAVWIGVNFWGDSTYLWQLVLFGEVISTIGVILQNEFILFCEDSTWTLHALYMSYLSEMRYKEGNLDVSIALTRIIFGGLSAYLLFCHLPSRFDRMLKKMRKYDMGLFNISPLFSSGALMIRKCSDKEKAWVVPMLLGMPCLMMLMFQDINSKQ